MFSKITLYDMLLSITSLLDYLEIEILDNITNHGRRTAYISLRLGEQLGLTDDQLYVLGTHALLHDVGAVDASLYEKDTQVNRSVMEKKKDHCIAGQKVFNNFQMNSQEADVIKYHHEMYDGTGFFGLKGDDIPLMSQLIAMADYIERHYLASLLEYTVSRVVMDIRNHSGTFFNPQIADTFTELAESRSFWLDLKHENIEYGLDKHLPKITTTVKRRDFLETAKIIAFLVDKKSLFTRFHSTGLGDKALQYARFHNFSKVKMEKFFSAALFHDIGKLVVPKKILDKPFALNPEEFDYIVEHPYFTEKTLYEMGLDGDIVQWASNHHEKINGTGYPKRLKGKELDSESRALAILDILQALTENRPYRSAFSFEKAWKIILGMVEKNELDGDIVSDMEKIFSI
ncbi:MAG: HD domain-containing protein [Spirochaetia bacterium]|nr:HD domain-containing protein [Spirochaetia bacterium]